MPDLGDIVAGRFVNRTEFPMRRLVDLALNVAVVVVGVAAVSMISIRLHDRFSPSAAEVNPRRVAEWRDYGLVGGRIGPPVAPVTVVEFADFQCPFCKQAWGDLREVQTRFPRILGLYSGTFLYPVINLERTPRAPPNAPGNKVRLRHTTAYYFPRRGSSEN